MVAMASSRDPGCPGASTDLGSRSRIPRGLATIAYPIAAARPIDGLGTRRPGLRRRNERASQPDLKVHVRCESSDMRRWGAVCGDMAVSRIVACSCTLVGHSVAWARDGSPQEGSALTQS